MRCMATMQAHAGSCMVWKLQSASILVRRCRRAFTCQSKTAHELLPGSISSMVLSGSDSDAWQFCKQETAADMGGSFEHAVCSAEILQAWMKMKGTCALQLQTC